MTLLKSFSFVSFPKTEGNPVVDRRTRTIERLEEQKLLLNNPGYVRKVRSFTKVEGMRTAVENDQRVSPWWKRHIDSGYLFSIKSGSKPIEFEKGKAAIAVPSLDKLPAIIDTLIAATRNGELDNQLAQTTRPPPNRKK